MSYKNKNEPFKFEQKAIEIDSFNKIEEEKMRKKIEKSKQKRDELAKKKQGAKTKKRYEQNAVVGKVRLFKQGV